MTCKNALNLWIYKKGKCMNESLWHVSCDMPSSVIGPSYSWLLMSNTSATGCRGDSQCKWINIALICSVTRFMLYGKVKLWSIRLTWLLLQESKGWMVTLCYSLTLAGNMMYISDLISLKSTCGDSSWCYAKNANGNRNNSCNDGVLYCCCRLKSWCDCVCVSGG